MLRRLLLCFSMPPETLAECVAPHLEINDGNSKGGNRGFACTHCDKSYKGSLTRQLAHLLGTKNEGIAICPSISAEDRAELQEAIDSIQNPPGKGSSDGSFMTGHAGMQRMQER